MRGRLGRWILLALAVPATLAALAAGAALIALHSLDRPWLKHRVVALARSSAGIDLDYRSVRLRLLSGVEIDGLVVRSPPRVRALAPDLARVDRVEARWSLASLRGRGPKIESLRVSGVRLAVVVDEHGRTSFDDLGPPGAPPAPPAPPTPLSRQAAAQLSAPPPVAAIDVGPVALVLIRTEQGREVERATLRGLSVAVTAEPAATGWRVSASLGSRAAPLDLAVDRERGGAPAGAARAKLWLTADADPSALAAALDVSVTGQTLAPDLPADDRLHAEAGARFDAAAGRTEVTLHDVRAGDGAITAEASIDLPDDGAPLVRHAQGDVDVAQVLRWAPAGMVPVAVERARLRYRVDGLATGPVVRLADGGSIALDADVSGVKAGLAAGAAALGSATLSIEGRQEADGAISGEVRAGFDRAGVAGEAPIDARGGAIDLRLKGVRLDAAHPLATRGDVALSVDLASLDARSPGSRAIVDGLALRAHALLGGGPPYAFEIRAPVSRLRAFGAGGRLLADGPARVEAEVRGAFPDLARPAASRGVLHAAASLGGASVAVDAAKGADAVDFAVSAAARSLGVARPFLPPGLAGAAPWDAMSATLRTSGRVDRLASGAPSIRHATEITLDGAAFGGVAARSIALAVRSHGDALRHAGDADLRVRGLSIDGGPPGDDRVTLSAALDRTRPSLKIQVDTEGLAKASLSAALSFDPARRAVAYEIQGRLAELAPLARFASEARGLEGLDLSRLELELSARGALLGVVSRVSGDGAFALEPSPARTAGVDGAADVRVANLRWSRGGTLVSTPAAHWHGDMLAAGARRTLESHLDAGAIHLGVGDHEVDLADLSDVTSVSATGDLADPQAEIAQHTTVRAVRQDAAPGYPVGDVDLTLSAQRDPDGLVRVSDMKLVNGAGGTSLDLKGGVDVAPGRHRLSMTVGAAQDLAPLSGTPERFDGQGRVSLEATVESPDLSLFRAHADLKAEGVRVRLPRQGIDVGAIDGQIPIAEAFVIRTQGGATTYDLSRDEALNPYSMLRFADQHPLLSRTGFLSIGSVKTPLFSIAPLVGNLEVEQNVFSLRQFEMGVRGGRITGECALDWAGPKSKAELHVRASGVQSSHGEPFDGNVAVVVSASDRTVQGRAEIVRIGSRHLRDLLDMEDPTRVDPTMNRIRTALSLGYPDRLRLVFDHGFASAHLELGGLARLVSIGDIRGIPMGPIIDKFLAPVSGSKGAP